MSKNTYPLKLPTSVKKAAAELAATEGVSLNQFIAAAVAEKVGSLRAADDFRRERAGTAKPKDMLKYLRRAPEGCTERGRHAIEEAAVGSSSIDTCPRTRLERFRQRVCRLPLECRVLEFPRLFSD
jgi:hypothetical protein